MRGEGVGAVVPIRVYARLFLRPIWALIFQNSIYHIFHAILNNYRTYDLNSHIPAFI